MTKSRFLFILLLPSTLLIAGCEIVPEDDAFTWQTVQEVFRREIRRVFAHAGVGSAVGSATGFLVALLSWQVYRGLVRCWGLERRDPWHSRFLGMVFLFVGTVLGGWIGMLEGGKRGVRSALHDGPIGKELLPQAGNAGADLLVRVDQFLQTGSGSADEALQQFRAGGMKLNVERLREKVSTLESASAKQLADFVLEKIYQENPHFKGELQETLLSWVVPRFAESLAEENRNTFHEDFDPKPFLDRLIETSQGQAREMTRKQLSQFFVDQVVVPDVFANLERQTNRTQRFLGYGLVGIVGAAVLLGLAVRPFSRSPGRSIA